MQDVAVPARAPVPAAMRVGQRIGEHDGNGGVAGETLFTRNGETFRLREAVHVQGSNSIRPYVGILLGTAASSGVSSAAAFGGKVGKGGSTRLAVRWVLHRDHVGGLGAGEEHALLSSGAPRLAHELFMSDVIDYISVLRVMDKVCILTEREFVDSRAAVIAKTGRGECSGAVCCGRRRVSLPSLCLGISLRTLPLQSATFARDQSISRPKTCGRCETMKTYAFTEL